MSIYQYRRRADASGFARVIVDRRIIMLSLDEFVKLGYDEEDYDDYVNYMHECRCTYIEDEDEEE